MVVWDDAGMRVSAEECQVIAQIAPVLLLAIVVDRRDILRGTRSARAKRVWVNLVRGYVACLGLTIVIAVPQTNDGADGLVGWAILTLFWLGVGGAMVMLWDLLERASRNDE